MSNQDSPRHTLGLFSVTVIVISLVIGMGIFKIPALVAATSGTESIFFGAWALGGAIALFGALTYAEIGARLPVMGGYYKVFAECYHPAIGFTVNALILVCNAASLAIVVLVGADFASDLLFGKPAGPVFNTVVGISGVALFYGVNILGLKTSSRTQNFLTLLKIGLVVLLVSALFSGVQVAPHGYEDSTLYAYNGQNGLFLLMVSLITVSFMYGGYQHTINFGGELRAGHILRKSIIIGLGTILVVYIALNYTYVQVIGFEKMKNATAIGALLCESWFGKAGAKVFDAMMFLSVLSYVNILLMTNPRMMFAMSEDGVFPKLFRWRHPRTGAMIPGLTVFALATILVVFVGRGIDKILGFTMFLDSIGMCTSAAAIFILRKRGTGDHLVTGTRLRRFTPFFATVFVVGYAGIAIAVVLKDPRSAALGLGLLLFFLLVYFRFYHKKATRKNFGLADVPEL
jgi:APA family basic amino acid/polyamine antiporter